MKTAQLLIVSILFSATAIRSFAQITIGSTPDASGDWGFIENSQNLGANTRALAQVIRTPGHADSTLLQFSFRFREGDQGSVGFTAAVAEWNGNRLADTVWTQTGFSTGTIPGGPGFSDYFYFNPNRALDGTKTYALLVLLDRTETQAFTSIALDHNDPGNTDAGSLYYILNPEPVSNIAGLAGLEWASTYAGQWDLEFQATFSSVSAVPEPSIPGLALGLSGLAGYAAWRRRRAAKSVVALKS